MNSVTASTTIALRILGEFEVRDGAGKPIAVNSRKSQALLAALALAPACSMPRSRIAGLLWSDRGDDQARASLRQALAALRKDLGDGGAALLSSGDERIRLDVTRIEVDAIEFRRLAKASDLETLRRAQALLRGKLLEDLDIADPAFESWLARERRQFDDVAIALLDKLCDHETGDSLVELARRLVNLDPTREPSHRRLMLAYGQMGERTAALQQYGVLRNLLRDEFGTAPEAETEALRLRLQAGQTGRREEAAGSVADSLKLNGDASGGGAQVTSGPAGSTEFERPSIAVLPFSNMSSDPEQEFFADGISEDLITDLSKIPGLLVIARHSAFAYRGKPIDIRHVAKDLGVVYVVEGSVRRVASRIRITVQLIDATDGSHIWADRFDRDLEDIFTVQDEVVGKIVHALADALPSAKPPPKRRAPKIEAYDLFVKGRAQSLHSPEANRLARPLLESACRLDPGFAEAHAWLAMNLHYGWMYCYEEDCRDKALALAQRAVALDPANADAHVILGYVQIFGSAPDLDDGREQFTIALEINRNHADAWIFLADLEVLEGRTGEALRAGRNAFRLNPHPPSYYYWLFSWALYAAKRYEDVIDMVRRDEAYALGSQRLLAASLAQLGRMEEAREVGRRFMIAMPQFTVSSWRKSLPVRDPRQLDHFDEGYIMAGLPG